MAVKTSPRRKRSSFKKQSGSYTSIRPRFQLHQKSNGETEIIEKRRRVETVYGPGHMANRCMCKNCRGGF